MVRYDIRKLEQKFKVSASYFQYNHVYRNKNIVDVLEQPFIL
jgi:hypothetical protein